MTLKGHTILYLLIAMAIIAAAVVAMTYLIHPGSQTETQGADAVPKTSSYGNQTYSTANSGTSQEIEENLTSVVGCNIKCERKRIPPNGNYEPSAFIFLYHKPR